MLATPATGGTSPAATPWIHPGRPLTGGLPLHLAGAFQREMSPQIHVLSSLVLLISTGLLLLATPPRSAQERRGRSE
jgi:hypothetical protein